MVKNMLKKQKLRFVTYAVMQTMISKVREKGEITEDDLRGYSDDIQKLTDDHIVKVDKVAKDKEEEIMAV